MTTSEKVKVDKVTKDVCRKLRERLDECLKGLGEEIGMNVVSRSGTYSETHFNVKVEFAVFSEDGNVMTPDAEAFLQLCQFVELKPEDLWQTFESRQTFESQGHIYTIIGMKPRSQYSILGRREDGRVYKWKPEDVKKLLKR